MNGLAILIAFLIPIAIGVVLYFTTFKKDVCMDGRKLYNCPNNDASICVKPGMNYANACNALGKGDGSGGFGMDLQSGAGPCGQYLQKPCEVDTNCKWCKPRGRGWFGSCIGKMKSCL